MDEKKKKEEAKKLEVEKLKKEVGDFKNKYLRALADYQNYEKRVVQEKEELKKSANKELLLKLLPFLDHLDKAVIFVKDEGLKLIKENFHKVLSEVGLEEIELIGKQFDPHLAEAIEVVEGKEENIIKEVLRKGYKYNGRVLRVAQVKVSKKIIN